MNRLASPRLGAIALAALVLVGASGCASGGGSAATPTATPVTTVTASTCVADPAAAIAATASPGSLTGTLPAPLTATLNTATAGAFTQAAAPGAIVGVRTPAGTWTGTYGVADAATGAPMTADAHTRVGSVTKIFTVTLVMQLAEQGALSLDDPIGKYVTGIPNGNRVTLRQLADMTSGVGSYTFNTAFMNTFFAQPDKTFTPAQLVAAGVQMSPTFAPGAGFEYSNTNTVLLGLVVEKITGQPVGDLYREKIFTPLGLTNTVWPGDSPAMPAPYAQGYTLQGDTATPANPSNATNWNPSWGYTAGELISNVTDMLTFARAVGTGQGLLGSTSQTERLTSFADATGYGIGMTCSNGWVGHTGTLPGYTTTVFYNTATDTSVAVLANSDIVSGACGNAPTLTDNPTTAACRNPAVRIFEAVSAALGGKAYAPPSK